MDGRLFIPDKHTFNEKSLLLILHRESVSGFDGMESDFFHLLCVCVCVLGCGGVALN